MEAETEGRRTVLIVACLGAALACWAPAAHAESLTVRPREAARPSYPAGSPAVEFAPCGGEQGASTQVKEMQAPSVGSLLGVFLAGTVLFGDSPGDFTPPPPDGPDGPLPPTQPPPPVDNPPPPTPAIPLPPGGPSSPLSPNTPPNVPVTIQGSPSPEPTTLLIGLIGAACAGAGVWGRRRKVEAV